MNTTLSRSNSRRRVAKQFAIEKHLQPSHSQYPIAIYLTSSSFAPDSSGRNNNNNSSVVLRVCQYSIPNAHALNYIESNDVRERERAHAFAPFVVCDVRVCIMQCLIVNFSQTNRKRSTSRKFVYAHIRAKWMIYCNSIAPHRKSNKTFITAYVVP